MRLKQAAEELNAHLHETKGKMPDCMGADAIRKRKRGVEMMQSEIERPRNCRECARFIRDEDDPNKGYCDEWPCVLTPDCVCHPNIGWKRKAKEGGAE